MKPPGAPRMRWRLWLLAAGLLPMLGQCDGAWAKYCSAVNGHNCEAALPPPGGKSDMQVFAEKHASSPSQDEGTAAQPPALAVEKPKVRLPGYHSGDVLNACWKPEQLIGTGAERRIVSDRIEPSNRQPLMSSPVAELPALPASLHGSIRGVDTGGKKIIALTFDFCEKLDEITGYDGNIIDYLRSRAIPATLFLGGKWMKDHHDRTLQLIADPLFQLGNHGWTHGNLRVMHGQAAGDQIEFTQTEYESLRGELMQKSCIKGTNPETVPKEMTAFRFPFGVCDTQSLEMANSLGLAAIQWDVVSGDPARLQTAGYIARTVLNHVKPGSIVVMHGNGRGWHTAAALAQLIPELQKRGYSFVSVDKLLKSGKPIVEDSCYELKPGDNARYDRLFGNGTGDPSATLR